MDKKSKSKAITAAVLVVVILFGVFLLLPKNQATTVATEETGGNNATSSIATSTAVVYKDGTYSATGGYDSPAGPESIDVTLVLKNGIITDATVLPNAQEGNSRCFQDIFISAYKQYVIGKSITDVNLSVVSGSPLTSGGWNQAIANIEMQASAA